MELDFQTVKALSSPTRLKILKNILKQEEVTTTQLSEDLGLSKSTVSSHLQNLVNAGLTEKDDVEGRRRVMYRPTKKSESILKGKERTVKFSIASSALSAGLGSLLIWKPSIEDFIGLSSKAGESTAAFSAQSVETAAEASNQASSDPEIFLFLGLGLLTVSGGLLVYGAVLNYFTE